MNKKVSLFTCFILMVIVCIPLTFGLVFSSSMMDSITRRFIYLSDGHVTVPENALIPDNPEYIVSQNEVCSGYVLLYSESSTAGVRLKGVEPDYFSPERLKYIDVYTSESETDTLKSITVSQSTADLLNVQPGSKIAMVIVPGTSSSPLRPVLAKVGAVYTSGYDQLDSTLAFCNIDYAHTLFQNPDSSVKELIVTSDFINNPEVALQNCGYFGLSETWNDKNGSVYSNFKSSRTAIFVVVLTVGVLAAFYAASVSNQLVQDNMRSIAVKKLLGATNTMVRNELFRKVYSVTVAGVLTGSVIGAILSYAVSPVLKIISESGWIDLSYYLVDVSIQIPFKDIVFVDLIMLFVSAVTILFSLKSTRKIAPVHLFTKV